MGNNLMDLKQATAEHDAALAAATKAQEALDQARAAVADHAVQIDAAEAALAAALANGGATADAEAALMRLEALGRGLERRLADCEAGQQAAEHRAARAEHRRRAALAAEAGKQQTAVAAAQKELEADYWAKCDALAAEYQAAVCEKRNFSHWSSSEVGRLQGQGWSLAELAELQREHDDALNAQ